MKKGLLFVWAVLLPTSVYADLRMVVRESFWGGTRKDTAVVWQTVVVRQTSAKIIRKFSQYGGFIDTVELVPNYTDSVFYYMSYGRKCFARSLPVDSSIPMPASWTMKLTAGTLQEKFLTDKRKIAEALCEHRQRVWSGSVLDSAGKPVGTSELEVDYWLPTEGFLGKEEIEFYNQFRQKKFGGSKTLKEFDANRISSVFGIRLVELEKKTVVSPIFPLEFKVTLRRKLGSKQREYFYTRSVIELHAEKQNAVDFMVPTGYQRIKLSEQSGRAKVKKR